MNFNFDKDLAVQRMSVELFASEFEDFLNYLIFYQTEIEVVLLSNEEKFVFRVYIKNNESLLNQLSTRFGINHKERDCLEFSLTKVIQLLHFHLSRKWSLGSFYSVLHPYEKSVFLILCYSSMIFNKIKNINFSSLCEKHQTRKYNGFDLIELEQISKNKHDTELNFIKYSIPKKEVMIYKDDDELFSDLKYKLYLLNSNNGYKHENLKLKFIRLSDTIKLIAEFSSDSIGIKKYEFVDEQVLKLLYETYFDFSAKIKVIEYIEETEKWKIIYVA